jgi:hypothetical protein
LTRSAALPPAALQRLWCVPCTSPVRPNVPLRQGANP